MDKQTQHKIFAEQITADYIEKITGEGVDRVVGKIPEDQFIVGQLAPYSPDAASFITSRVVINGIGLTFNISCEALNTAIIKTQLCGNWFYRVLPSYEEQCKETIRQYNKLFDKEYTSITEFINDEEVQSTLATTDNKKSNSYDIRLLQIYKKVSLEDLGLYVTVKLSDVYDQENNLAYVDDLHSSNLQIYEKIQQVIKERVLTDPQYYAYDIRSKMTLQDLKDVDSWNKFFSTEVKEAKNLPNWNVAIILEAKKIDDHVSVNIKMINKAELPDSEKSKKRFKESVKIPTIFNARIKVEIQNAKYLPIKLTHFKDDYKYDKEQAAFSDCLYCVSNSGHSSM